MASRARRHSTELRMLSPARLNIVRAVTAKPASTCKRSMPPKNCRKARIGDDHPELSTAAFRVPPGPQLTLFD